MTEEQTTPTVIKMNLPANVEGELYDSPAVFDYLQRVGKLYAESQLVPEHYRKNIPDATIAAAMARRMNVDPFVFMQHVKPLNGKACIEGKLVIALINKSGFLAGPLDWEWEGELEKQTLRGRAKGVRVSDNKEIFSSWISIQMAKGFGWYDRSSNWKFNTENMIRYRSASFFERVYCPGLTMGLPLVEEVMDVEGSQVVVESQAKNVAKKLGVTNDGK